MAIDDNQPGSITRNTKQTTVCLKHNNLLAFMCVANLKLLMAGFCFLRWALILGQCSKGLLVWEEGRQWGGNGVMRGGKNTVKLSATYDLVQYSLWRSFANLFTRI